jgi:hypothetical protein
LFQCELQREQSAIYPNMISTTFQDSAYRSRTEVEISTEKKRNTDLQKREKQLKSQIDNLIKDSLGLLETRLRELGIQAKTPPEFIEKAKGIVSSHHALQRNKSSLESDIRELEESRDMLLATKENDLTERLMRDRKDLHPSRIREYVKKEVEVWMDAVKNVWSGRIH